jgi:hypothetical protein
VTEKIVETLAEVQRTTEAKRFDGEWLPLAVWASKGYDAEEVKNTATLETSRPCTRST